MIRNFSALVCFLLTLLLSFGSQAFDQQDAGERDEALAQLHQMLDLLAKIEYPVEWHEKGRLIVLRNQAQKIIQCIEDKKMGLAYMGTLREYQWLIIDFRYSTAYFNQISTGATHDDIAALMRLVDTIVVERGFDDSPYTQMTFGIFSQLKELINELSAQPGPDDLRSKLGDLLPQIGQVLAVAKQGDRPHTFAAAQPVLLSIRALYPSFVKIDASETSYETVLNIQGLAELYAEFAQIDDGAGAR